MDPGVPPYTNYERIYSRGYAVITRYVVQFRSSAAETTNDVMIIARIAVDSTNTIPTDTDAHDALSLVRCPLRQYGLLNGTPANVFSRVTFMGELDLPAIFGVSPFIFFNEE